MCELLSAAYSASPSNIQPKATVADWLAVVTSFLGDLSEEDPPVPIPNTEVKLLSPDGTARATVWESRKSPGLIYKGLRFSGGLLFMFHHPFSVRFRLPRLSRPVLYSNRV